MSRFNPTKDHRVLLVLLALVNVFIHLAFYNTLGFHRDELLYFSLGQHLSAGYASVPPFTGFIAWCVINTLGYSLFAARLLPALLSGVYLFIGAGIARELKGGKFAQIVTAIGILVTPLNLRAFYLFQPVCWDLFFWGLIFYLVLRWINTQNYRYLLFLGIATGIGLMNKYLILLEVACLMGLFTFSSYRNIFRKPSFYLAFLIALIILLPNILWQIINHLPVLTHMDALHNSQLVHVDRMAFFTDQLFLGSMAIILILPGIVFALFNQTLRPWRPVMLASLLVVILLAILRGKSYYTVGLFPLWIAAGSVYWERTVQRNYSRAFLILGMVALTIPLVPMGIPVYGPDKLRDYFAGVKKATGLDMMLRWETGRIHELPQDYADMLGWDEIASLTSAAYKQVPEKKPLMIYAQNYGEAGAVMVLGKNSGLPEPVCFSESFYYWFPRNPSSEITSLIYINDEMGDDVSNLFKDIRVVGQVTNPLARECGIRVWLCTQPRQSFNKFWKERILGIRSPFE